MMESIPRLAPREHEVLQALSRGDPYKRIASDLGISISTVQTLVERSYRKLEVNNKIQAVLKYANRQPEGFPIPSPAAAITNSREATARETLPIFKR